MRASARFSLLNNYRNERPLPIFLVNRILNQVGRLQCPKRMKLDLQTRARCPSKSCQARIEHIVDMVEISILTLLGTVCYWSIGQHWSGLDGLGRYIGLEVNRYNVNFCTSNHVSKYIPNAKW